ncbi:MAG: 50S ribosomal protein L21 [Gammaproteobacteria bacterium]|nr:MAG: 50S ribosomal protein L21 [Gammaproteobacteria bacterium]
MFAVIETGGKQYRVAQGQTLRVEKLPFPEGEDIALDKVLLIQEGEKAEIGTPYVEGAKVMAKVKAHGKGRKIRIIKLKRRKHHMKRMGHRQPFTELEITGIVKE